MPAVHPCPRSTHARGASTPVELGIFQFLALSLKMHIPLSWTNLFLSLNVKMSPWLFHRFRCNKHNITWPHCVTLEDVGIVICCCPWTTKGHTHRWRQIHVRSHVSKLVFLFSSPNKPIFSNKPFPLLLHKTNRLHFSVCVYCNGSQKTRLRLVSYLFFTRCDLLQYTRSEKCYLYLSTT